MGFFVFWWTGLMVYIGLGSSCVVRVCTWGGCTVLGPSNAGRQLRGTDDFTRKP